jgi:peptidoglycan/LPS O-acetylase OafA/YrhL
MTKKSGSVSRQKTDYLRGVAILTVVLNHFLNEYATHSMGGYANGMMSVFFILSGYGIYYSLSREIGNYSLKHMIGAFWKRRILRIYPLFWIYYIVQHGFNIKVLPFLGLDFIRPVIPWFVPAILQCYIVAPVLFLLMKKCGIKIYAILMVIVFIALNFILLFLIGYPSVPSIAYHGYNGLFFSHVLLFGTGLIIARLSSAEPKRLSQLSVCFIAVLFIFFLHETTPQTNIHFSGSIIILEAFFLVFSALCVYSLVNSDSYLPFSRFFQGLGIYSYSIYLFHCYYFNGLEASGILKKYDLSLVGILICILLLPLFLAGITYFEEIVNRIVNRNFDLKEATKNYCSNIFWKNHA